MRYDGGKSEVMERAAEGSSLDNHPQADKATRKRPKTLLFGGLWQ